MTRHGDETEAAKSCPEMNEADGEDLQPQDDDDDDDTSDDDAAPRIVASHSGKKTAAAK